ncbi:type II toxin-antitoxin system RelB/DinJ family antitoxin [uncultured Parasutterella sp.]|jgi:addiction module antitoxin, RelB/DinJ family|uniref:type II toxin-antitoxin system RelB/DinJ family antitoxin n=1 Tax=uncultured Parasutterella sp. TaxID=1263098 RepID=UPI00258AE9C2|nr:type II toxin-antitoxin system RelB/DinJ family antitoxin [uncultured Parasutterella sp.]
MPTTASNDSIRIRVNKELKKEASELLSSMGLNFSDFFRISLLKLVNEKKMPFSIDVPNQETIRAMQAAENGDVTYHESVSSYFKNRGK